VLCPHCHTVYTSHSTFGLYTVNSKPMNHKQLATGHALKWNQRNTDPVESEKCGNESSDPGITREFSTVSPELLQSLLSVVRKA
jgi:hypothetical protein